ncbi:DUF302 domain-containing protein [Bhargavaea ullalensis]|uniref:Uncharacterized protein (DUF302 family) n=1 Tax=Bhargavaea ullalensis TaxID=1265685 RepID=A0ABV2G7I9_9BACL
MFDYTVNTRKTKDEAVKAVEECLSEVKFGVLWNFDMTATLQKKGQDFETPVTILEVCSPAAAAKMLKEDLRASYLLPCKIVVYEQGGSVKIGMPKPTATLGLMENAEIRSLAEEVEGILKSCIDKAAQ